MNLLPFLLLLMASASTTCCIKEASNMLSVGDRKIVIGCLGADASAVFLSYSSSPGVLSVMSMDLNRVWWG